MCATFSLICLSNFWEWPSAALPRLPRVEGMRRECGDCMICFCTRASFFLSARVRVFMRARCLGSWLSLASRLLRLISALASSQGRINHTLTTAMTSCNILRGNYLWELHFTVLQDKFFWQCSRRFRAPPILSAD